MTDKLILKAKEAMQNAYAPYSKFKVGASLLLNDGTYILGANVENASYGLTNCAERSAIFSALSLGYSSKDIKAIAIIADDDKPISPCGACRQVMYEHLDSEVEIVLTNLKGEIKKTNINELLPYGFKLENE